MRAHCATNAVQRLCRVGRHFKRSGRTGPHDESCRAPWWTLEGERYKNQNDVPGLQRSHEWIRAQLQIPLCDACDVVLEWGQVAAWGAWMYSGIATARWTSSATALMRYFFQESTMHGPCSRGAPDPKQPLQ